MKLRSLLTILDKPKHRQTAFERAMDIQERTHAHVDLAGFCWHAMADANQSFDARQRSAIKKEILRKEKEWQRRLAHDEPFRSRDISLETVWARNIADWTIDHLAKNEKTDLVVKSAHRSHALMHTPLDWNLLQRSPVPLLLSTHKKQHPSLRVVAAIDLQDGRVAKQRLNRKVMDAAHTFANLWGGVVHCIGVVEYSDVLHDLDLINLRQHKSHVLKKSEETLNSIVSTYKLKKSQLHLPAGKVGERVNQLSHKLNADLLVVGTHAYQVKDRVRLGSSAERILTKARCDVLAVPP